MVDTVNPSRRSRLFYPLVLLGLVAGCGFVFQWTNHRLINVVGKYKNHAKIFPARPLRSKADWKTMPNDKKFSQLGVTGVGSNDTGLKINVDNTSQNGTEVGLLEPESITDTLVIPTKWKTWKGTKESTQIKQKHFKPSSEFGGQDALQEQTTISTKILASTDSENGSNSENTVVIPLKSTTGTGPLTLGERLNSSMSNGNGLSKVAFVKSNDLWDSPNHLLSMSNFTRLLKNDTICTDPPPTANASSYNRRLVVLVRTTRNHFRARNAIRQSYGQMRSYKDWRILYVFLVGQAALESGEETTRLNEEQKTFGDIVMGNVIDSVEDLSYKHLMGIKWLLSYCSDSSHAIIVNDNVFIQIIKVIEWIKEDIKNQEMPDLYCKRLTKKPANFTEGEYQDYCQNWFYLAPFGTLKKIYSATVNSTYVWRDDVFVTGILREKAKQLYKWKSTIKDISPFVSQRTNAGQLKRVRQLCEGKNKTSKNEILEIPPISYLPRGSQLEKDMKCLWQAALRDIEKEKK